MKLIQLTSLILFIALSNVKAQSNSDWKWGTNEAEAKGAWLKMERLIKQKKYNDAAAPSNWLLKNTPDLNVSLYVNAIKIFEKRERKEKDKLKKVALQDSTLFLYDKRIELFGNEAKVLNRKGRIAWKYLGKRGTNNEELFNLYKKIHALNGNKTLSINMYNLMKTSCTQFANKKITKEEVFDTYNTCISLFDLQLTTAKKKEKVEKYKGLTTQVFTNSVEISCSEINSQFGEKFEKEKTIPAAKLIITLSVAQNCFNDSCFISAAEYLSVSGKSNFALEKILANTYLKQGKSDLAITTFERSILIATDSNKIGLIQLEIAKIKAQKGDYLSARSEAKNALAYNPNLAKAFELIGDLYFQSTTTCDSKNVAQKRAIYIAAYNMYMKAGNSSKANEAKAQFPSVEELFTYNLKAGDTIKINCWINESVILKTR